MSKKMRGKFVPLVSVDGYERMIKLCSFCGEWKLITEFAKNGVDATGAQRYRDDCKTCYNVRRRETDVTYTHQQWKEAVIYFGGECAYCGCTMRKGMRLTRDHLVPVAKGGKTIQSNIVPACSHCNSSKQDEEWREWYMKQPFFSQERMNKIFKWRTIIQSLEGHDATD